MKPTIRILIALLLALVANVQGSQEISYWGRATVAGQYFDGTGQFKFLLVKAAGTKTLWTASAWALTGGDGEQREARRRDARAAFAGIASAARGIARVAGRGQAVIALAP